MTKEELLQTYFYIEDISGSTNTVTIQPYSSPSPTLNLEYSTDGITWITATMNSGTTTHTFTIPANGKLYLRGVNNGWCESFDEYNHYYNKITCSGKHNVGGNIMSLLYGSEFVGQTTFPTTNHSVFNSLFYYNKNLVNAKDLILPATTLTSECYRGMFSGCSSLTTAPELPATTLTTSCYRSMFSGCIKLNYIKADFINYSNNNYEFGYWVSGVSSTGTFIMNSNANYNPEDIRGESGIPNNWVVCKSNERVIIVINNNDILGTVTGSGIYAIGETVTLTAVPTYKGKFVSWSDGNTELTRTIEITEDLPYLFEYEHTAIFEEAPGICFINESDNTNVLTVTNTDKVLQYSVDNVNWNNIANNTTTTIEFSNNITIKGTNISLDGVNFKNSELTLIEGNIMTLLHGDNITTIGNVFPEGSVNTFKGLFKDNVNLVDISKLELPETTVEGCYSSMFQGCTSLGKTYMKDNPLYSEYFYIQNESSSDGVITITLAWSQWPDMDMYYSYDKKTWTPVEWITPKSSGYTQIPLYSLGKVYIKQMNKYGFVASDYGWVNISTTNIYSVGGNIMSLLYGDNFTNIDLNDSESIPPTSFQGLFFNDNSGGQLIHAHDLILPALSLSPYCYSGMFYNCIYLKTAPVLPATSLSDRCYHLMFNGCTQLENLQMKYSGRLTDTNYVVNMFHTVNEHVNGTFECPSNIQYNPYTFIPSNWEVVYNDNIPNVSVNTIVYNSISSLPAIELSTSCYSSMFQGCSNLEKAPTLPATTLAESCYHHMFTGCTGISRLPQLPATNLSDSCYHGMFMGCDGINKVSLPEAYLAPYAYSNMFLGSHNLSNVNVTYNENVDETNYKGWLKGVSIDGTFTYNYTEEVDSNIIQTNYHVPDNWDINYNDPNAINYFYVENISGEENTVCISHRYGLIGEIAWDDTIDESLRSYMPINLEYSYDKITWESVIFPELTTDESTWYAQVPLPKDGIVYFRNLDTYCNPALQIISELGITPEDDDYYSTIENFGYLFSYSINVINDGNIGGDIRTLSNGMDIENTSNNDIYTGLFSLIWGYDDILFENKIISAENLILPATTLAEGCYNGMFYDCSSLTTVPELPATTLASTCYQYMFSGCSSLTTAPELPATTLAEGCYNGMFEICESLTTAPALPATTLAEGCYNGMFYGCSKLTEIYAPNVSTWDWNACNGWVYEVADEGTMHFNTRALFDSIGGNGNTGWSSIPSEWTAHIIETDEYIKTEWPS